jgi:hypothetical protein
MATKKSAALLVRQRDSHCPHCGETEGLAVHHRRNRQMGGSKVLDRPDNLMLICPIWNGLLESDSKAAQLGREWGHKLNSWDGFDTPIFDYTTKTWWLLDQFGNKHQTEPPLYLI